MRLPHKRYAVRWLYSAPTESRELTGVFSSPSQDAASLLVLSIFQIILDTAQTNRSRIILRITLFRRDCCEYYDVDHVRPVSMQMMYRYKRMAIGRG